MSRILKTIKVEFKPKDRNKNEIGLEFIKEQLWELIRSGEYKGPGEINITVRGSDWKYLSDNWDGKGKNNITQYKEIWKFIWEAQEVLAEDNIKVNSPVKWKKKLTKEELENRLDQAKQLVTKYEIELENLKPKYKVEYDNQLNDKLDNVVYDFTKEELRELLWANSKFAEQGQNSVDFYSYDSDGDRDYSKETHSGQSISMREIDEMIEQLTDDDAVTKIIEVWVVVQFESRFTPINDPENEPVIDTTRTEVWTITLQEGEE